MRVRDVIRVIEADGRYLVATEGSHRQYRHPKEVRPDHCGRPSGAVPAPGTISRVTEKEDWCCLDEIEYQYSLSYDLLCTQNRQVLSVLNRQFAEAVIGET